MKTNERIFIVTEILIVLGMVCLMGCGRMSDNPYDGSQVFPLSSTFICTNKVLNDGSVTQFAGVVDCSTGQILFSADRYKALSPIAAGVHPASETGLRCSFTVDASCNISNVTH